MSISTTSTPVTAARKEAIGNAETGENDENDENKRKNKYPGTNHV